MLFSRVNRELLFNVTSPVGVRENWRPANVRLKVSGRTCDGVGVEVPGLFRHVEDARDEGLGPGRQFTEKQSRAEACALRPGKEPEAAGGRDSSRRQRDPDWA